MASAGGFQPRVLRGRWLHQARDIVQFGLTDGAQVGALGEELARATRWCSRSSRAAKGRAGREMQMSIFRRRASSGWQAISDPRSQVMERRSSRGPGVSFAG